MAQSDNHGRFAWHELMTSDVAAARSFYETVVGWTTSTWGDGSVDYMMWMAGEVPVGGLMRIPSGDPPAPPPNWLTYIAVNHVDDVVEATTRAGGSVILPARTVPGVGRFAVLRDPQGAAFGAITGEGELPPETDPKPLEFSWHELVTTDYKAAAEFYEKVFGWVKQSEFDMGDMGTYYMFGRDRFTYGGMMNTLPGMDAPPYWLHYAQVSDSADAAAERAKAAGGTIVQGPMEVPGGDRICVIVDPQGASFAVHSKAPVAAPDFKPAGADSVRA